MEEERPQKIERCSMAAGTPRQTATRQTRSGDRPIRGFTPNRFIEQLPLLFVFEPIIER